MNKKFILIFSVFIALFFVSGLGDAKAQTLSATGSSIADTLSYPIAELGDCKNKGDCQGYCEKPENMLACVNFGLAHGMVNAEEARVAKIVIPKIVAGKTPGGCKSKQECEDYCQNDNAHLLECAAFVEETGILPPDELTQVKNIAKAVKDGAQMPGNCTGKSKCETYCKDTSHIEECLNFAEKAQILPPQEIADARKVMKFLQNGETPGKCATKEACMVYCKDETHFDECISFAEKAGLVDAKEADIARKTGGKGPGGCQGTEECSNYCNLSEHAKECANFAIEKGVVDDTEKDLIINGAKKLRDGLSQIPEDAKAEVKQCLVGVIGGDNLSKIESGQEVSLTKKQGDGIGSCIESVMSKFKNKAASSAQGAGAGSGPSSGAGGPPANIPSGAPSNSGSGTPPADYKPDAAMCSRFATVPSCDLVPAEVKSICLQCK